MAPETPRRPKPDQKPVTIDLEAKDVRRETEDPASVDAKAATSTSPAASTPADDTSGVDASQKAKPGQSEKKDPLKNDAGDAEKKVAATPETDAQSDARANAAAAAFEEKSPGDSTATTSTGPKITRPAYEQRKRESSSGALAAGIVGGLVTLLGAGVLQYAGVLPPLGPGGGAPAVEQTLLDDVAAMKAQLASGSGDAFETRIAALEQKEGGSADLSGVTAQIDSLTNEIAALKTALADARQSTEAARSELSSRLDAAEQKIEEPASDVQLARAVAVTALKTSIDRGGPFLAELDALKTIAPDDPAVAGLADDASGGVTPRADLLREFPAVATTMLDAAANRDPNQGVFARLVDSASSAIRVRPVGSVEGTGPDAVVARIEDRLTNGDLKGASLEWDALPESARTAGAAFRQKLDQRIRVEGLIDAAVTGSMKG